MADKSSKGGKDHEGGTVGPGSPPHHTRFKPGQSGNPKGRPKGSKNFATSLERELRKRVTITENGRTRQVTQQEVIARRLTLDSMKGVHRAIELVMRITAASGLDTDGAVTASEFQLPDKAVLKRIHRRIGRLVEDKEE